jgi:hypothetical protein
MLKLQCIDARMCLSSVGAKTDQSIPSPFNAATDVHGRIWDVLDQMHETLVQGWQHGLAWTMGHATRNGQGPVPMKCACETAQCSNMALSPQDILCVLTRMAYGEEQVTGAP